MSDTSSLKSSHQCLILLILSEEINLLVYLGKITMLSMFGLQLQVPNATAKFIPCLHTDDLYGLKFHLSNFHIPQRFLFEIPPCTKKVILVPEFVILCKNPPFYEVNLL